MNCILSLDQGSSGSKGLLLSQEGHILWSSTILVKTHEFPDERVEQDPQELLESLTRLLSQAQQAAKNNKWHITGIALSTQRSGVCAFDKSGQAVHPLITWRDRRTLANLNLHSSYFTKLSQLSGLPVLPDYSGSKISLLQKKYPDKDIFVGTLDSFLIYNLSDQKAFVTDDSMAARSLIYNLKKGEWGKEQCKILDVDITRLAKLVPSYFSKLTINKIPLKVSIGDGQAALLAYFEEKQTVLNLGTIASISIFTDKKLKQVQGFISSIAYSTPENKYYILEGVTNACGDVIKYLQELLNLKDIEVKVSNLTFVENSNELVAYLPIRGTATPLWIYNLPNKFSKDLAQCSPDEILQAGILSIGSFIAKNINILLEQKVLTKEQVVVATGGLSNCNLLLDYISKVTGINILKSENSMGSAYGAALLALSDAKLELQADCKTINKAKSLSTSWAIRYFHRWRKLEKEVVA